MYQKEIRQILGHMVGTRQNTKEVNDTGSRGRYCLGSNRERSSLEKWLRITGGLEDYCNVENLDGPIEVNMQASEEPKSQRANKKTGWRARKGYMFRDG